MELHAAKSAAEETEQRLENELWELTTIAERAQEELSADQQQLQAELTAARLTVEHATQQSKVLEETLASVRDGLAKSQDEARRAKLDLLEVHLITSHISTLLITLCVQMRAVVEQLETTHLDLVARQQANENSAAHPK